MFSDLGDQVSGRFLSPDTTTATSSEPTNPGFDGAFQSGPGETFGGQSYNLGVVKAGQIKVGLNKNGIFFSGADIVDVNFWASIGVPSNVVSFIYCTAFNGND